MKTIIGNKLEDYIIYDSLGEKLGKVKDVIVDTTQDKWLVKDLVVSTGVIGKQAICFDDIKEINEDEKQIILKDNVRPYELDKDKFSHSYLSFNEIKKRDVLCENEAEVGKIYDYVIGAEALCWQIHNILLKPKGEWLKGRRIRLNIDDVIEVNDQITVKPNQEEIKEKCVEEEP